MKGQETALLNGDKAGSNFEQRREAQTGARPRNVHEEDHGEIRCICFYSLLASF